MCSEEGEAEVPVDGGAVTLQDIRLNHTTQNKQYHTETNHYIGTPTCRPGTRVNTARERVSPRQDREEQRMVRRESTEVRGEEEGSTWFMSINTAKLVRWEQEHLVVRLVSLR